MRTCQVIDCQNQVYIPKVKKKRYTKRKPTSSLPDIFKYCRRHKCSGKHCLKQKISKSKKYCDDHICQWKWECQNPQMKEQKYCPDHVCQSCQQNWQIVLFQDHKLNHLNCEYLEHNQEFKKMLIQQIFNCSEYNQNYQVVDFLKIKILDYFQDYQLSEPSRPKPFYSSLSSF